MKHAAIMQQPMSMMNNLPEGSVRGIGNDLVEISRIRASVERHGNHFLDRLFTRQEQDYCCRYRDPAPHFAGRFAAKEAIVKALGTGFGAHAQWHDIEILNDDQGKPIAHLSERLQKYLGISATVLVSISHDAHYATAVALFLS